MQKDSQIVTQLETERLLLRRWKKTEFSDFLQIVSDEAVKDGLRYSCNPTLELDAWKHFALLIGHWSIRKYGEFAYQEKSSGEIVGFGGFSDPQGIEELEVTWCLKRNKRGIGLATEATRACCREAKNVFPEKRIVASIFDKNLASKAVAIRCGFTHIGTRKAHGPNLEEWEHSVPETVVAKP